MKKETIVSILFILVSITSGIFLSMFPNTNVVYVIVRRIGYSLILAGLLFLTREFTFNIRKKLHSHTFSELFDMEEDMIELRKFIITKKNNKIIFKIDLLFHHFNLLFIVLLCCASTYIILPGLINYNQNLLDLSDKLISWMIIFFLIFIITAVISFFFILLYIFITYRFNIIKIIDVERQTFTIINRKRNLTIPFSNLKELEVWKNEDTKSHFLIAPITNHSGDISIINSCRSDDSLLILRDNKTNEFLEELKDSMLSYLTKFSF